MHALVRLVSPLAQDADAVHDDVDAFDGGQPRIGREAVLEADAAHARSRARPTQRAGPDLDCVTVGAKRRNHAPPEESMTAEHERAHCHSFINFCLDRNL